MRTNSFFYIALLVLFAACNSSEDGSLQFKNRNQSVPAFNVDSAYAQVVRQVEMGPRNPGSEGHQQAEDYLINQLKAYAGSKNVFAQRYTHRGYDSDTLAMANIIAAFNPSSADRIMLCAHWDTRPRSDQDSVDTDQPILGADDGASGVAVLLEIARLFHENPPPIGVDIVFFDGEDYGKEGDFASYFIGSRFWSNYPPVKNYNPRFGILLDMVGGEKAQFPKEGNSEEFAPALVNEIWSIAKQKGFDDMFINKKAPKISDDHLVINRIREIPTIDIIRYAEGAEGGAEFAPYWHTKKDNLNVIDKGTLKAVGEVLTELVYNRI